MCHSLWWGCVGKGSRSNQVVKVKGAFNGAGRLQNEVQKQGHTQEIQEGANPKSAENTERGQNQKIQKWAQTATRKNTTNKRQETRDRDEEKTKTNNRLTTRTDLEK